VKDALAFVNSEKVDRKEVGEVGLELTTRC